MWASTVPAALDGLLAMWADADALQGVKLVDGPNVSSGTLKEALIAGWEGDESTEAVTGSLASGGLALAPDREQYTINCAVMVLRGTRQMAAARARAYELFAAAAAELVADKTLRGAVMTARLGSMTLTQTQDSRGAIATVLFGVDCDAMTLT